MGLIKLTRIDSRLIHGQVITKWVKATNAATIVIIDEDLAKDSFMKDICMMAAPKGISLKIYDIKTAVEEYRKDEFGNGNILILFKDFKTCFNTIQSGVKIEYVQLGGLANSPGKKAVFRAISIDDKDIEYINELLKQDIEIAAHIIPEESKVDVKHLLKKY